MIVMRHAEAAHGVIFLVLLVIISAFYQKVAPTLPFK